jgi:hypothetical protein
MLILYVLTLFIKGIRAYTLHYIYEYNLFFFFFTQHNYFFNILIRSRVEYASIILNNLTLTDFNRIENIQTKFPNLRHYCYSQSDISRKCELILNYLNCITLDVQNCLLCAYCLHPWWWRRYAPLKRRSTIILHGSTSQKTILNIILAAVRTWNLTCITLYCQQRRLDSVFVINVLRANKLSYQIGHCCYSCAYKTNMIMLYFQREQFAKPASFRYTWHCCK